MNKFLINSANVKTLIHIFLFNYNMESINIFYELIIIKNTKVELGALVLKSKVFFLFGRSQSASSDKKNRKKPWLVGLSVPNLLGKKNAQKDFHCNP